MEEVKKLYKPREYLSVSSLTDFCRCPRKFFYSSGCRLAKEDSAALSYGLAMHKAVPVCLDHGADEALRAFASVWEPELSDNRRNFDRAERSLRHYDFTHKEDKSLFRLVDPPEGAMKTDEDTSDYEIPFAIDVGLRVPLVGRIDGWCVHRDTGELWGWEFKTSSSISSAFFTQFEMNLQVLVYSAVLRMLSGKPVRGVMVEGMLVSTSKVDNLVQPIEVPEHRLDEALRLVKLRGQQLLDCEDNMDFPKDFTGCSPYTNFYILGPSCEYLDLCEPENPDVHLSLYKQRPEFDFVGDKNAGQQRKDH